MSSIDGSTNKGQQELKSIYQYNLIHGLPINKDNMNSLEFKYVGNFQNSIKRNQITLPNDYKTQYLKSINKISDSGKNVGERNLIEIEEYVSSGNTGSGVNGNGSVGGLKFCKICYNLLLPGLTVKIRIKYDELAHGKSENNSKYKNKTKIEKEKNPNLKKKKRYLSYQCLKCNTDYKYMDVLAEHGSNSSNSNLQKTKQASIFDMNLNFKSSSSSSSLGSSNNITKGIATPPIKNSNVNATNKITKNRSKKRKQMNSLSNLLSNKKNKSAEKKNGLDLLDFMN